MLLIFVEMYKLANLTVLLYMTLSSQVHALTEIIGLVGETVILQCQTFENRSQWIRENTVYGDRGIININLPHKDKLKIVGNIQRGEYNLQIENVSRSDAGVYKCFKTIDGNVNTTEVLLNIVDGMGGATDKKNLYTVTERSSTETHIDAVHAMTEIIGRVGETVILHCQTFENRSQWIRENTVYGDRGIININLPHKHKLKIVGNIQRGEYNLQIENVSRADAGVYKCIKTIDGKVNTTEVLLNIVDGMGVGTDKNTLYTVTETSSTESHIDADITLGTILAYVTFISVIILVIFIATVIHLGVTKRHTRKYFLKMSNNYSEENSDNRIGAYELIERNVSTVTNQDVENRAEKKLNDTTVDTTVIADNTKVKEYLEMTPDNVMLPMRSVNVNQDGTGNSYLLLQDTRLAEPNHYSMCT
ncbi:uncharacterized protein LOC134713770 [Mytilus trossulus]|uniref:uncharacterized protein LOC134713770 n=1 Tax=Mytilus trossulus TaxID=6551 RepID=UPI003003BEE6